MQNADLHPSLPDTKTKLDWLPARSGRSLLVNALRFGCALGGLALGAYGFVAIAAATIDPATLDRDFAERVIAVSLLAGALTAGIWATIGALLFVAWARLRGSDPS